MISVHEDTCSQRGNLSSGHRATSVTPIGGVDISSGLVGYTDLPDILGFSPEILRVFEEKFPDSATLCLVTSVFGGSILPPLDNLYLDVVIFTPREVLEPVSYLIYIIALHYSHTHKSNITLIILSQHFRRSSTRA